MTIFTTTFWADAAERAIKTMAQSLLAVLVGDQGLSIINLNYGQAFGVAATATVISILTSIVSATVTSSSSASLAVKTVPKD